MAKDKTPDPVPTTPTFSDAFLTAINTALTRAAVDTQATTILYRRANKLDLRVKIDLVPPTSNEVPLIYQEPPR